MGYMPIQPDQVLSLSRWSSVGGVNLPEGCIYPPEVAVTLVFLELMDFFMMLENYHSNCFTEIKVHVHTFFRYNISIHMYRHQVV